MTDPSPRLVPVGENLWGVEHDLALPGGIHFPGRMTVARLPDEALLLHSVVPIDDELARAIAALGGVRYIVAPNALHHVHLEGVAARYPEATLYGVPALTKKHPSLELMDLTDTSVPFPDETLMRLPIAGAPKVDEVVLMHHGSKSLIVADLFFNVHEFRGWLTPWVFRLVGAYKRFAQSRSWRLFVKDRALAGRSAERILEQDFERIVVAHGRVLESDAKCEARQALVWLAGSPKALPPVGAKS
jgi:hypothetical protein